MSTDYSAASSRAGPNRGDAARENSARSARATASVTPVAGRRVTVMGLGLFGGGVGAARWLARNGAEVVAVDLRDAATLAPAVEALAGSGVEVRLGPHEARDFEGSELIVANPAVAPHNPWLRRARAAGVTITSEVELFLERCPAPIAAVTGTQGKSSTSSWLAAFLAPSARRVHLGGNIGGSLLEALGSIEVEDRVVLELSSYQLEALAPRPALDLAIITNVLADHLERHGDVAGYRRAKARILDLVAPGGAAFVPRALAGRPPFDRPAHSHPHSHPQRDVEIVVHSASCEEEAPEMRSAITLVGGRFHAFGEDLAEVESLGLPGRFQRANVLVALAGARRLGVPAEALARLVPTLVGLPHRVEELGWRSGVRVIDNGVSTTPDSTIAALDEPSLTPAGSARALTVLLGGAAKRDLALDEMARALAARDALCIVFGAAAEALAEACDAARARWERAPDAVAATALALARTPRGGTLLFSPACASFDAWPNFEARARAFRAALPALDDTPPANA